MNWISGIFGVIGFVVSGVLFVALFLLLLWKLITRTTKNKVKKLCQHLDSIGIKASISMLKEHTYLDLWKTEWTIFEYIIGTIELEDTEISSINVIRSGGDWAYYKFEYIVKTSELGGENKKQTSLKMKRSSLFGGRIVEAEWKGDIALAQKLNLDGQLRYKILNANFKDLQGIIGIVPHSKFGYTSIRTYDSLPTPELFDILETVAKHIKSG